MLSRKMVKGRGVGKCDEYGGEKVQTHKYCSTQCTHKQDDIQYVSPCPSRRRFHSEDACTPFHGDLRTTRGRTSQQSSVSSRTSPPRLHDSSCRGTEKKREETEKRRQW